MEIKTGSIDGINIKYIEYNPKDYDTKLINVSENWVRKSVKDFCDENKGEVVINGGLFNYGIPYNISGVAKYVDGVYNSLGSLANDTGTGKPAIICEKKR